MDEMGIDCTTTSPFSFEKESGLLMDGWKGLGIKICLFIACCAWVCFLIPGYGGWKVEKVVDDTRWCGVACYHAFVEKKTRWLGSAWMNGWM
jgi:hypothetical protein